VFVGNDTDEDEQDNQHAKQVVAVLEEKASWLKVVIATSTTDNPQRKIEQFQAGEGDVLIVKQMGGVGMDVPRLKVCLDLSTFRTAQLFTQRICRIATVWQYGPDPKDLMLACTYITPDDRASRDLFDEFIGMEGGDASKITEEYLEQVLQKTDQKQWQLPDTFVPTGQTEVGEMSDTQQRTAPGEALSEVRRICAVFPEITTRRTEPEIANILEEEKISIGNGTGNGINQRNAPVEIHDINAEQTTAQGIVAELAKRVTRKQMGGQSTATFGDVIKNVYVQHKRMCRLPLNAHLEDLDVDDLERLAKSLREELNR
jgi:hypothetical protein